MSPRNTAWRPAKRVNHSSPTDTHFPVVAVGASAGGLEAFTKFVQKVPSQSEMAIILVQHLDPAHQSMMVDLLAPHTKMPVSEATEGTRLEPAHIYVIAPGTCIAVHLGTLVVTKPKERRGARMPFNFLLRSLAENYGEWAIGVVLSGSGADGSIGLATVKDRGGLVIAQDPEEAAHKGMPQSAIDTGAVDLILPIASMPAALTRYAEQLRFQQIEERRPTAENVAPWLLQIKNLLRDRAAQDFTAYKPGTLMRRVKRRMAIHGIPAVVDYVALLRDDANEINILAKDLLIHVTGFFRDPQVFAVLEKTVIPQIVREHASGQPIRVWIPACSTGEEVYSLAMLFLEEIAAAKKNIKLQMFGTDIEEQAVTTARTGTYPLSLEADVSPARLERFFIKASGTYRVAPALRETVIFNTQDVLTDPPFAQLDFVSCRNLLIYLLPEVQQRVLSLLHFSLRKDGILLLGISESVGPLRDGFEPIAEEIRIFRRIGSVRKFKLQLGSVDQRAYWPRPVRAAPPRDVTLEEISQRQILNSYGPASIVINERNEGLYYFGPTEKYLQVPTGQAGQGIFSMVRPGLRNKLRTALKRARLERAFNAVRGGTVKRNGTLISVRIEVAPVQSADDEFFLISFIESSDQVSGPEQTAALLPQDVSRNVELEKMVEALQNELQEAASELEQSSADQEAINEEAQSLNEEYQSTNEELETSKEEMQSLNEELTSINAQLTATVNQQRATADDLENILRSSELPIIFLDSDLNIRFFSSAAKALLGAIDSDIGRPIGDLALRFNDAELSADISSVLKTLNAQSREIRAKSGEWYNRRALPFRTLDDAVQGVVLTFSDISAAKGSELKLEAARTYANSVIDAGRQPLVVVDQRLRIVSCNSSFFRMFTTTSGDAAGQMLTAIAQGRLNVPAMNSFLDRARAESAPIEDYEIEIDLPPQGRRILLASSRKVPGEAQATPLILLSLDDITERKFVSEALEVAKSKAEKANLGKSRFLAAASHDLRQPLQTLTLLHGVLARQITSEESLSLIGKLDETLGAMSGMLDTLLDINQLEAGTVQPEIDTFVVSTILDQLKNEFSYVAKAKGIALHVVPSTLRLRTDPLLLSQMLRNLLSNAVKYTKTGKILFGCRRAGANVRLEIWDTGIGIPSGQLRAIFEEYHQLANPARERGLGLGLGLAIVSRIGELLGHQIEVRSEAGRGSVFTVEVPRGDKAPRPRARTKHPAEITAPPSSKSESKVIAAGRSGTVLIVEDDPTVREALELLFKTEGYRTVTATDGIEVAALTQRGALMPDVVIADYNLPGGRTGLEVIRDLRAALSREIPGIVLTGDIATDVLRKVVAGGCGYLHKPVNVGQLTRRIDDLLTGSSRIVKNTATSRAGRKPKNQEAPAIFVVDDDEVLLGSVREMLQHKGHVVETHPSAESFLSAYRPGRQGCLIVDSVMPGMSGLELIQRLKTENRALPSIVITGFGDIPMAIKAMKVGAIDFIEKPTREDALLAAIGRALAQINDNTKRSDGQTAAAASIRALTRRERDVMDLVVEGLPNKEIAALLKVSQRTVEAHRASVMKRTGAASLPDLIRLVMRAS